MYNKGTIVLIPFPFTDLSANKVRPALIVSYDAIGADDIIVVFISSAKVKNIEETDIVIKDTEANFHLTGLKATSVIKVNKIATLNKNIVLGELGKISKELSSEVNKKLKILFDI